MDWHFWLAEHPTDGEDGHGESWYRDPCALMVVIPALAALALALLTR